MTVKIVVKSGISSVRPTVFGSFLRISSVRPRQLVLGHFVKNKVLFCGIFLEHMIKLKKKHKNYIFNDNGRLDK